MALGRSVKLYLVDGTSTGLLTAEIMNWTGHVLAGPRTLLEKALSREELKRTGVYFLHGPDDEDTDLLKVYVGESDEIAQRLYQHNRDEKKEFWEGFVAVTSKDMNLTKAHVKYLEGQILDLLHAAKKAKVANGSNPSFDKLPEADIADMQNFLSEIELILPVIGLDFLKRPRTISIQRESTNANPNTQLDASQVGTFGVTNVKAGILASAREIDGEFIVLAGSTGSLKERMSFKGGIKKTRDDAMRMGQIAPQGKDNFVLTEDMAFSSPSAAAVFLFGTSRNGRSDWIETTTNQSYGEWKVSLIEQGGTSRG